MKSLLFFEESKAVLLNDQLNGLNAKQQLSTADLAQEKGFQQTVLNSIKDYFGSWKLKKLHRFLKAIVETIKPTRAIY